MSAPTVSDLQAATPAAIDYHLSQIWQQQASLSLRLKNTIASLEKAEQRKERQQARGNWFPWDEQYVSDLQTQISRMRRQRADLEEEAEPFQAEFARRGGWARYFLVTNGNGHVHNGTNCGTCYPTTTFAWLVELAGKNEAAMVEKFGHVACTRCFPSAPVEEMRRAHEAAQAAQYCTGSGLVAGNSWRAGRGYYGTCQDCNKTTKLTLSGTMPKHKPSK